jgi:predicted signal transduction protein with EAL and GGDEF domain
VTRWCRHGAAIVLAFMICVMHYALTASTSAIAGASVVVPGYLIPAQILGLAVVGAVLLVMVSGFSTYRIAEVFAQPFQVHGQPVTLTASIDYSIFPIDTPERDQVLSNAKLAMHRGKSKQRGLICQYRREMDHTARARRALARDLQTATVRGELELHYQLQMRLGDRKIVGAEALMRWRHPKRGMILPAEFIPLAKETEAIVEIGEWALRTACRDAAAAAKIPGTVAVNLSPVQFKNDKLAETIHAIRLETGLSPRRLEVEVTESTVMSDQSQGLHILRKLKAMGISVAMDDFGAGYSSLATLHAFPFDKLKLDQSFVKRLPDDAAVRRDRPYRAGARRSSRHAAARRRHRDRGAVAIP